MTSCLDDYRDADALDRIFVRAYQLSEGNVDVRKLVASARQQLSTLRGFKRSTDTDVGRKMDELRREAGLGPIATVSEALAYLASEGDAADRLS